MDQTATSAAGPRHLPLIPSFFPQLRGPPRGHTPFRNKAAAGPWKGGVQTPGLDGRQEAETTIELQLMFL